MLSNFFVALGGVVPLFCLMAVGLFVKHSRLLTEEELRHVNSMVFRVFFFFMMFYNIYAAKPGTTVSPLLVGLGAGGVLLGLAECAAEACFCVAGGQEVLRQGGRAEDEGGLLQIGGGV